MGHYLTDEESKQYELAKQEVAKRLAEYDQLRELCGGPLSETIDKIAQLSRERDDLLTGLRECFDTLESFDGVRGVHWTRGDRQTQRDTKKLLAKYANT